MQIRHIREAHFQAGIICPRCHSKSTKRNGKFSNSSERQRYLCKSCGRTFTDLTGTPLAYVKKPNHLWTEVARCMREGMSCRTTAEELDIAVSTVFRWRHKILAALRERTDMATVLGGIIEADETIFPRSFKGSHFKNPSDRNEQKEAFRLRFGRNPHKRGKEIHERGRSKEQVPVLVIRDRTARTVSVVMESMKKDVVRRHLMPVVDQNSVLCTDALPVYRSVCKEEGIQHKAFNMSRGLRVDGVYHIQNVNSYHSRLKTWMLSFKGVATKYLGNYMTWFEYIDTTRAISHGEWERRFLALSCIDILQSSAMVASGQECVICHKPVTQEQDVGTIYFVSHKTGKRTCGEVCHKDCFDLTQIAI